ncbi:ankyrin repeat-containing domain protein [Fusarium tricinctum]|uniref:Ankyrin repeat-containing domain protein n=1 Tax=Fusarium tricinctum TaxID=61284 RepID=A0A8K0RIA2_9HYPO|nr:ankyrin repeat-containing domain protein [Fusarium tricinctum]
MVGELYDSTYDEAVQLTHRLLWTAVKEGRKERVSPLLRAEDIDINGSDHFDRTLLLIAADLPSSEIFMLLLDKDDTELNTKDRQGNTPLSLAVRNGDEAMATLLLAKDKIEVNPRDMMDCTPLHAAAFHGHEAITKLLLDRPDIELNPRNTTDDTPLHEAASNGHEVVTWLLLARDGIELNSRNEAGYTPLVRALYGGTRLLLSCSLTSLPQLGNSHWPLTIVLGRGERQENPVQLILGMATIDPNSHDAEGRTPLPRAAENNSISAVHLLLGDSRIDVDCEDLDCRTPLSRAIENQHNIVVSILAGRDTVTLHSLVREGNLPPMEILLDNGYDLDARDSKGQTSLHLAIFHNHFDIAEKLLSRGADVNAEDYSFTTPLSLAIRLERCNFAELLLCSCASIRGIKVESWRALYTGIPPQFNMYISETASGAQRVDFSNTADVLVNRSEIERLLCISSTYEAWWLSMDRIYGMCIPSPTTLSSSEDTMRMVSNYHCDSKRSTAFAIALVPNFQLAPKTGQVISWEGCGVGWTLDDFERSSGSTGKTRDHQYYSMLQDSWIPNHGIELFLLFLAHLTRRWLNLCDQFEEHLSRLRYEQLESHGKRPETISCLAENALHIAKLRRSLQSQVRGAKQFIMNLVRQYGTGSEQDVDQQLQSLDQIVRDLLQLEFAWVSINEAHRSTSLATSMKRLSWITFIFLPAMFATV